MNKRIISLVLVLLMLLPVLPISAAASSTTVTASYSGGVVSVTGTGFTSGTTYYLRVVSSSVLIAIDTAAAATSGALTKSITTGVITSGTLYVNTADGASVASCEITFPSSGGGGGSSSASTGSNITTTTTSSTTTTAATYKGTLTSGVLTATVSTTDGETLIANAKTAEAAGQDSVIKINVTGTGETAAKVVIPRATFDSAASQTDASIQVSTTIGTVTLDSTAVETISAASATGNITISVSNVDSTTLTAEQQSTVGDNPVFDIAVYAGTTAISSLGGGTATVSVPYTLKEGEDPQMIVVYYLDSAGNLQMIEGWYDDTTETVIFETTHFSYYTTKYNDVSFSDVATSDWYCDAVQFIAARNITSGTGNNKFSPNNNLTRGQFIVLIMKAYGIEVDTTLTDNFSDAGSTYYTHYLATAKKLGITNGVGDNQYKPESNITRQDMFTLLYRTLDAISQLPETATSTSISRFSDSASVSSYATEAVDYLIKAGIVNGSNGKINPTGLSTRAQMAQIIFNLLSDY